MQEILPSDIHFTLSPFPFAELTPFTFCRNKGITFFSFCVKLVCPWFFFAKLRSLLKIFVEGLIISIQVHLILHNCILILHDPVALGPHVYGNNIMTFHFVNQKNLLCRCLWILAVHRRCFVKGTLQVPQHTNGPLLLFVVVYWITSFGSEQISYFEQVCIGRITHTDFQIWCCPIKSTI